jgi:hypothetical protein
MPNLDQQIASLQETLQLFAPDDPARQPLERKLAELQAQRQAQPGSSYAGTVTISGGTVQGPVTGLNMGNVQHFTGPPPAARPPTPAPPRPANPLPSHSANPANKPLRIFLCHANEDKPTVRQLRDDLRNDGFEPWFDEEDLLPGHEWRYHIEKAVRECDIFLVCLSQQAVSKTGFLHKEIAIALDIADEQPEGSIFIIPLKLEACDLPDRLSRWQWCNLYEHDGYERLLRALQG